MTTSVSLLIIITTLQHHDARLDVIALKDEQSSAIVLVAFEVRRIVTLLRARFEEAPERCLTQCPGEVQAARRNDAFVSLQQSNEAFPAEFGELNALRS
ncbi:MAG: hypothetical protein U0996_07215 [Planctomycetaceae bacterium]